MCDFMSCAAGLLGMFVRHRIASDRWSKSYEARLKAFDRHCARQFPDAGELCQAMVDGWFRRRDAESPDSCRARIWVVVSFLKYLHARGKCCGVSIPETPRPSGRKYMPHAFTDAELKDFLGACDNIHAKDDSLVSRLKKLQVPVVFRLMLSSGMRPVEACSLRVEDVDLETGVVSIRKSKGHGQHHVVLGDCMLDIMRKYDIAVSKPSLLPGRDYVFQSGDGGPYETRWLAKCFKELWRADLYGRAVPYDLRHHYATRNINGFVGRGIDFNAKLVYLSKSMGHSRLESTQYYYSLVPLMSDILHDLASDSFDETIPDVDYEDQETW